LTWDADTRKKLAARLFSESGEKPTEWNADDDEAWSKLKAREAAPDNPTPSEQQRVEREECIAQFDRAVSNEDRQQILRDFLDQHFEAAIVWPWFKERCDALAMAGLLLYAPAHATPSAVAPKGFDGLGKKKTNMSEYFDSAALTDRQRDCLSMKWEYELSVTETARRLDITRKTVDEHIAAGKMRMDRNEKWKQRIKRRAVHPASQDE